MNSNTMLLDFSTFNWDEIIPKAHEALKISRERIDQIKQLPPSFDNTILGIENCDKELSDLLDLVGLFLTVKKPDELSEKIDSINQELSELVLEFSNDITFDQELFKLVSSIHQDIDTFSGEKYILIKEMYKGFVTNGINLSSELQSRLRELDQTIGNIAIKLESNLQKENISWVIDVASEDTSGIPSDILELAKDLAEERGFKGYSFKIDDTNFYSIMEYAQNRNLRKIFSEKFRSIGNNDDEFDNKILILEYMQAKKEQAIILGYENYAQYILTDRMAKSPQKVINFLNQLENALRPYAEKDFKKISNYAIQNGINELFLHDESFYETKIKEHEANIDMQEVRKYFPYQKVMHGLFKLLQHLYNIQIIPANIPTYHPDVEPYFVKDNNDIIAIVYFDNFPRDDKQSGAWMLPIVSPEKGKIPSILVACNFNPKTKNQDSLLSINDVKTIFHEMGHALHAIFSKVEYQSLAGINVAWDFVELPSQIMENFVLEDFVLDLISEHVDTKEVIPQNIRLQLKKSETILNAMGQLSYIGLGKIDMELHTIYPDKVSFEALNKTYYNCKFFKPYNSKENRITNFGHILGGGYDAGFYSYQWAKVLDVNCYEKMKSHNFSQEIMSKFRKCILEVGSTRDENISFLEFCGHEPTIKPFLKYYGIE